MCLRSWRPCTATLPERRAAVMRHCPKESEMLFCIIKGFSMNKGHQLSCFKQLKQCLT